MKRIIYIPDIGESIYPGSQYYTIDGYGDMIDVIVPNAFTTNGTILYDSAKGINFPVAAVHHFQGWEF